MTTDLASRARHMRQEVLRLAHGAGGNGAHIAPSLSCVEILVALYGCIVDCQAIAARLPLRDRVILGKGHAGLAQYVALAEFGLITREQLDEFEKDGGDLPGQPSQNIDLGLEFSSGSLGLGITYAAGLALGLRECCGSGVYVICGDGELNEGSVWEAAMFAGHSHLENLTVIVDRNSMQSDGFAKDILSFDISGMFAACGFDVRECDGHDADMLAQTISCEHAGRPLAVIAKTVKGKGVPFMENNRSWHHARLNDKQYAEAISALGEAI